MRKVRAGWIGSALAAALVAGAAIPLFAQAVDAPFPEPRPGTRMQAEAALGRSEVVGGGVSVRLAEIREGGLAAPPTRRAAGALSFAPWLPTSEERRLPDGVLVRYTTDPTSPDALDPADRDGDGTPDALDPILRGWSDAASAWASLFDGERALPAGLEIVVVPTAPGIDGYLLPAASDATPWRLVLAPSGGRGDADRAYRATVREAAFVSARAREPSLSPRWADALSRWFAGRLAGVDDDDLRSFATRRDAWHRGLVADDPSVAAGNALWLRWLEEAHGTAAVRVAIAELASHPDPSDALDRIGARIAGASGADLQRDFQVWTLLTGDLDDGLHFSFAGRLSRPTFAVDADWLPVISVQSDAPIAPLGGSIFRLAAPGEDDGGLTVRFEGGFDARWSADLLLRGRGGTLQRVPIALDGGRGEVTVPRSGLAEAFLLVRNDADATSEPARFTWSAHAVRGFPFELAGLEARVTTGDAPGVLLSWETSTETRLLGFHVLRRPAEGGVTRRATPIWIPAIGGPSDPAAYQYLDAGADPGRAYVYRIEGITLEGLTASGPPVLVGPSLPRP